MKFKYLIFIIILFIPIVVSANADCGALGDPNTQGTLAYLMQEVFDFIQLATPVLVIVLSSIDFIKAVTGSKEDEIVKAFKNTVFRVILGFALFMLPMLINFVLDLLGLYGTCGIG